MDFGNPSPLVVECQTKFHFKIWSIVMIYVEIQAICRFGGMILKQKIFRRKLSLHTQVHKTSVDLGNPRGCCKFLFIYLFFF